MPYCIRYTPHDLKDNFDMLILRYSNIMIYKEKASNLHYHIWIDTDRDMDTIREYFRKCMNIPKVGRGEGNKYYSLKKWDYNTEYIEKDGEKIYNYRDHQKIDDNNEYKVPTLVVEPSKGETLAPKKERKDEWGLLLDYFIGIKKDVIADCWCVDNIKREICKYYLKKLRPIPRYGDLNRYAHSINILLKSKYYEDEKKGDEQLSLYFREMEQKKE